MPDLVISIIFLVIVAVWLTFRINMSSIAVWDTYASGKSSASSGVIYGTAKAIRSDEWLVKTPWIFSQINSDPSFSIINNSIGASSSPLFLTLPVSHWSSILRPQNWGFFLFEPELAFSWLWLFHGPVFVLGLYFLFRLFSSSVLVALSGALWFFFSSFTQWWLISLSDLVLAFATTCFSFSRFITASSTIKSLFYFILFIIGSFNFSTIVYPPFQISLALLGICLLPLFDIKLNRASIIRIFFLIGSALLIICLWFYENLDLIKIMQQTDYPGKRQNYGGNLQILRYFSGFFDLVYTQERFPAKFGNVCEASAFLLIWPFVIFKSFFYEKLKLFKTAFFPLFYIVFLSIWMTVKLPNTISNFLLLSMVPTTRAIIGLGLANVILCCIVVSQNKKQFSNLLIFKILITFIAVFLLYSRIFESSENFNISKNEIIYSTISYGILLLSIIKGSPKLMFLGVFLSVVYPNHNINPLSTGIKSLTKIPLFQAVQSIPDYKNKNLLLLGSSIHAQIVKAAGGKEWSGTKYSPDLPSLKLLDNDSIFKTVYNRYAHIQVNHVENLSSPIFKLTQEDSWHLDVNICEKFVYLYDINYVILLTNNVPAIPCLSLYKKLGQIKIFEVLKKM